MSRAAGQGSNLGMDIRTGPGAGRALEQSGTAAWSFRLGLKATPAAGTPGKVLRVPPGRRCDMAGLMRMDEASSTGRRYRAGGLLWRRDFRLLWFGETISEVGTSMAVVAVPLLAVTVLHASTFMVSALVAARACLLGIGHRVPRPEAHRRTTLRVEIADGVRLIGRDPYLRPMGLFGAVGNLALTGNQALAVVFLVRVVGLGPFAVGLLLAVPGAAGLLGALTSRRVTARFGTARGLLLSTLVLMPFGLLIPLTEPGPGVAFYTAGTLLAASGIATASIIINSFRQAYSPPQMRGRAAATFSVLLAGTSPLGALRGAHPAPPSASAMPSGSYSPSPPGPARSCSHAKSPLGATCPPPRYPSTQRPQHDQPLGATAWATHGRGTGSRRGTDATAAWKKIMNRFAGTYRHHRCPRGGVLFAVEVRWAHKDARIRRTPPSCPS
jgi:Major Facilitator Superfamily